MKKREKIDLIIILIYPIIASLLSFLIKANFFTSTLIFFGIPALYLSIKYKKYIKKIALFSLILGVPFAIFIDYIMSITGGWSIPYSIFDPFRLFNLVSIDGLIWTFLYIYFITIFYEVFLDKKSKPKLYKPNLKYLAIISIILFGTFFLIYLAQPSLLQINFFYLKVGLALGLLPILLVLFRFPKLYGKFFKAGAYFFFLTFTYEITALLLNQWTFPNNSQFIGFINILGITFPLEELVFWMILGAIAMLSYFEFFDDDKK